MTLSCFHQKTNNWGIAVLSVWLWEIQTSYLGLERLCSKHIDWKITSYNAGEVHLLWHAIVFIYCGNWRHLFIKSLTVDWRIAVFNSSSGLRWHNAETVGFIGQDFYSSGTSQKASVTLNIMYMKSEGQLFIWNEWALPCFYSTLKWLI